MKISTTYQCDRCGLTRSVLNDYAPKYWAIMVVIPAPTIGAGAGTVQTHYIDLCPICLPALHEWARTRVPPPDEETERHVP